MANGGGSSGRESIETRKITLLSPTSGGVDREGGGGGRSQSEGQGREGLAGAVHASCPSRRGRAVAHWHGVVASGELASLSCCMRLGEGAGGGGRGEENDKITVAYKS